MLYNLQGSGMINSIMREQQEELGVPTLMATALALHQEP